MFATLISVQSGSAN
jgi:hypothetical protein